MAQSHLVLLKSKMRQQRRSAERPPLRDCQLNVGFQSRDQRGASPTLLVADVQPDPRSRGRFERIANGGSNVAAVGNSGSFAPAPRSPAGGLGRPREAPRARGIVSEQSPRSMTWDPPAAQQQEECSSAMLRAATARRPGEHGRWPSVLDDGYSGNGPAVRSPAAVGTRGLPAPGTAASPSPLHKAAATAAAPFSGCPPSPYTSLDLCTRPGSASGITCNSGREGAFGGMGLDSDAGLGAASGAMRSSSMNAEPEDMGPLIPCPDCGRSFNRESLTRHIKICKKVFVQKRKQFNSAQARLDGFENASELIANAHKLEREKKAPARGEKSSQTVPKWQQKSLAFRQAILAAKAATGDVVAQQKADAIQQTLNAAGADVDSDLTRCPHCGRTFNKEAGERHIAICVKTFGSRPGGGRLVKGGGHVAAAGAVTSRPGPPSPSAVMEAPVLRGGASMGAGGTSMRMPFGNGAGTPTAANRKSSSHRSRLSTGLSVAPQLSGPPTPSGHGSLAGRIAPGSTGYR